jgi:hypothetical protein
MSPLRTAATTSALRLITQRLVSAGGRLSTVSGFPTGPIVPFDLPGRFNMSNYSLFAI